MNAIGPQYTESERINKGFVPWDCSRKFSPEVYDWNIVGQYIRPGRPVPEVKIEMVVNLANCAIAKAMISAKSMPMGGTDESRL